jgi:hypothetical protein
MKQLYFLGALTEWNYYALCVLGMQKITPLFIRHVCQLFVCLVCIAVAYFIVCARGASPTCLWRVSCMVGELIRSRSSTAKIALIGKTKFSFHIMRDEWSISAISAGALRDKLPRMRFAHGTLCKSDRLLIYIDNVLDNWQIIALRAPLSKDAVLMRWKQSLQQQQRQTPALDVCPHYYNITNTHQAKVSPQSDQTRHTLEFYCAATIFNLPLWLFGPPPNPIPLATKSVVPRRGNKRISDGTASSHADRLLCLCLTTVI